MRIGPSLILASRQTLAMTPQLQQAIKLLQFSHLELAAFIQQELEKNPLLSEGASDDGPIAEPRRPRPRRADRHGRGPGRCGAGAGRGRRPLDARTCRPRRRRHGQHGRPARRRCPTRSISSPSRPRSLAVYVLEQIDLLFADVDERRIALKLAEGLDEAGYCRLDVAGVAEAVGVSARGRRSGVGAAAPDRAGRTVRPHRSPNVWRAQLAERDRLDPAMKALLDNLDLVAAGELGQLRRRCGVDDEDLRDMLAELRTLDPRPGQAFDFEPIQPVAPDLLPAAGQGSRHRRGGLVHRAQHRRAAQGPGRSQLPRDPDEGRARQARSRLRRRALPVGQLAGQDAGAARHHDPEGGARDRPPAGRLLPPRRERAASRWCCATSPSPPSCTRAR